MKKTFRLEKSGTSTAHISKFDVLDSAGSICGRITVDAADASEFLSHWVNEPHSVLAAVSATSRKRAIDSILAAAAKRGVPVVAPASSPPKDPMVAAMLRAAPKHRLSPQACLRG